MPISLAKSPLSGTVQTVARAGSAGSDEGYGITVDSSGNVYVTGIYAGTMTFYNYDGTVFGTTLAQIGSDDMFIAKYNISDISFTKLTSAVIAFK
jgi:hypothetical protein